MNNGKETLKFTNGTLFGIKEFNSKQDTLVLLSDKTKVYKISIDTCDKLVAKSDDYKGSVKEAAPKAASKKPTQQEKPKAAEPKEKPKFDKSKLSSEELRAFEFIEYVDKGGMPLITAKINTIARDLGLDVSKTAKPEDTVERIRAAVARFN